MKVTQKNRAIREAFQGFLISFFSIVFAVPIFAYLYNEFPTIKLTIGSGLEIGPVLLASIIFLILYVFIRFFYRFLLYVLGLFLLTIIVLTFVGKYSFNHLYYDYAALVYSLKEQRSPFKFEEKRDPFSREALIVYSIDYNSAKTREVASNWAIKNFDEYKYILPSIKNAQTFSIYKEVRRRWNYVFDPEGEDLYVKSSNTLKLLDEDDKLKGDCDDYSITMAALVKAIGGEVHLVRTLITNPDGTVTGHIYPEVKIGDKKDLESVAYLIKNELFEEESKNKQVYYYQDKEGFIWLNFDYFDSYPGGKYPSNVRVSVLDV